MAIEFNCTTCGRLLSVGDDAAGKLAKCPECGGQMRVPATLGGADIYPVPDDRGTVDRADTSDAEKPVNDQGLSPEGTGQVGSSPFGSFAPPPASQVGELNPYQSPVEYGSAASPAGVQANPWAAGRVAVPAIGLIVTGGLALAFMALSVVGQVLNFSILAGRNGRQDLPGDALAGMIAGMVLIVPLTGLAAAMIYGAVKMKNLESYAWSMTVAIIAVIPCYHSCCGVPGLVFGIWAIIVLCDPQVKAAFGRSYVPGTPGAIPNQESPY